MKKAHWFYALFSLCSTCVYSQQGQGIYKKYCAGCHGSKLEGNSASRLIKTEWKHGSSPAAIHKVISSGIPGTDMMAWSHMLKDEEIRSVVSFILASQKNKAVTKPTVPSTIQTGEYTLAVEKLITENMEAPWAIEFTDANRALISERGGSIRWFVDGKFDTTRIAGLPATHKRSSTGGYMDIAIDPDYGNNGWVYLAYSHTKGNIMDKDAPSLTRIVRGKIRGYQWTDQQTLFEAPDSLMVVNGNRWGCRLLFDKSGHLFFTIGDMGRAGDAQDLSRATGKVFRIHPDGSVPADNPFVAVPNALPAIFSYGNRNVQGIDQHPETGKIWMTEHGPRGGDELNILKKGANYGWPVITYGIDYSGKTISDKVAEPGMEQPVIQWTPSIAVCPLTFCAGPLFPKWKNNLLVGALAYEELYRLVVEGDKVISRELIFKGYGRVRDIKMGPEGAIYVLLNKPDLLLRLTLAK